MANRYWVGGTAAWDGTAGTKWALTSGGTGGQAVPTSDDDVYFDVNSGINTVTVSNVPCGSLTCTGFAGSFSGSGQISVHGSLILASTMTSSGSVWYLMWATTGSWTINSGGLTVQALNISRGASYTLSSNLTLSSDLTFSQGTLNTANFNISAFRLVRSGTSATTISLGSSTITLTSSTPLALNPTGLTFNAGTSTFNCTSTSALTFAGVNLTFYNVNFTGGGTSNITVNDVNTFNNLSVTATTAGTRTLNFAANQTINGTLSVSGTTSANRIQFGSDTAGTQRTISLATIGTLTNTNWKDIALTGAASPWTAPVGVFDLGNNSGITFDTTTLYWVGGTGNWTDGTKWSTSSGGSAVNAIPGPTNNVIFNSASNATAYTITAANGYCKDLTVGAPASGKVTFTPGGNVYIYGSVDMSAGSAAINNISGGTFNYMATTTGKTINFADLGPASASYFSGIGGGWTLQSNLIQGGGGSLYVQQGSLNTNGYTVTCLAFYILNSPTLTLGSSSITPGNSVGWNCSSTATINAGTSTITLSNSTAAFVGGGKTYYNVVFSSTASGGHDISGNNTFNNLTFPTPVSAGFIRFNLLGNQIINGTLTANGSSGNKRILIWTNDFISQRTITAAAVSLTDVNFYAITGAGAASWSGTRLGDIGKNSGITFDSSKTVYWNLAAGGNLFTATGWATSSGGTPATVNTPLPQDTAIIENTGLNSGATVSYTDTYVAVPALTFATRTIPVTFATAAAPFIYANNVTFSSSVTRTSFQEAYFLNSTTYTSAGVSSEYIVFVYGTLTNSDAFTVSAGSLTNGGTLTLGANLTITLGSLTNNGTVNLNSYTLTAKTCILSAASTTNFGTGNITLTGNNVTIWNTNSAAIVTGTPVVNCTYSGATGTRGIAASTPTEANTISFNVTAGTDIITLTGSIKSLNLTGFAGTLGNNARTVYGNWTNPASGITFTAGANTTTFAATSGTQTFTTNGVTLDFPITQNGAGGTVQLNGSLTLGSTRTLYVQAGTFNANNNNVTAGLFRSDGSNVRTINMGSGTWTLQGTGVVWNIGALPQTGLTLNAGTSTIVLSDTSATARTFSGGGLTYNNLTIGGTTGTSTLTFQASNTFNTLSSTKTVAHTILFTASTTNTFTNFNINGTAGNVVTIGSASAASHTLAKAGGGTVTADYLSISYSTATPTLTWLATNSTNGGNNSGWYFGAFPPPSNGNFFLLF